MKPQSKPHPISNELRSFILDRRSRHLANTTIIFYQGECEKMMTFFAERQVTEMEEIDARILREYFVHLADTRNGGGIHAAYRAIKCFLNWWESDVEPEDWNNPIRKVDIKRPRMDAIKGIPMEDIDKLLETCEPSLVGQRDRAMIMALTDCGARRMELLNLTVGDVNLQNGEMIIQHGKGDKLRSTYLGVRARKELARYMRFRPEAQPEDPLWVTHAGTKISVDGMRYILKRRAELAGIKEPGFHQFRRTFAIESLRNGANIYALMRMMGHTSPGVLQRYLHMVQADVERAHEQSSPMDNQTTKKKNH